MKKGFTLVELSITIVIIGLLIGGLLVGQSLIESARSLKLMKEIAEIEINFHRYKSIYRFFPGDHPAQYTMLGMTRVNAPAPDGNGVLDSDTERLDSFLAMNRGIGTVYKTCQSTVNDLAFRAACNNLGTGGYVANVNITESKAYKGYGFVIENCAQNLDYSTVAQSGVDCTHNYISLRNDDKPQPMTVDEIKAIDAKFDDGKYSHGRLVGGWAWHSSCNDTSDWTQGVYSKTTTGKVCTPLWMLFDSGPDAPL